MTEPSQRSAQGGNSIQRTPLLLRVVFVLALVFTTLAFNLLGDGLRDAFDPRSRI